MNPRRAFRIFAAALALAAALGAPAGVEARPPARTEVTLEGDTIFIKARIEISGERATDAFARVMEGIVNRVWQDPANQHTLCGFKIRFDAEVRPAVGRGTEGWHQIYLVDTRPGQWWRSNVAGGVENAYSADLTGEWDPNDPDAFAHEVGHLFGSPDEYGLNWDWEEGPNPGREGTLMADNAPMIDSDIVNNILQNAFSEGGDLLPVCIRGTYHQETNDEKDGQPRNALIDLTIDIQPGPDGQLQGTAKGGFSVSGTVTEGDCSFSWSTSADIDLDLTITGSGNGPYTIQEELPILVEETQRHYLCAQAVDLTIQWTVGMALEEVTFEEAMLPNGATVQRRYDFTEGVAGEDNYVEAHLWKLGTDESAP